LNIDSRKNDKIRIIKEIYYLTITKECSVANNITTANFLKNTTLSFVV